MVKKQTKIRCWNVNLRYFLWTIFGLFLLAGGVYASNYISSSGTSTLQGIWDFENITAENINQVLYVQAGNGSDIQAKVDLCPSNGCKIYIPEGNYNLDTIVTLSSQNIPIIIEGDGEGTYINLTNNNGFFVSGGIEEGTTIRNIKIDANNGTTTILQFATGIHDNLLIENVHIFNTSHLAISFNGSNVKFENNYFEDVANGIVSNTNESRVFQSVKILNNKITNVNHDLDDNEGIDLNWHNGTGTALISGNYISGFRQDGMDINVRRAIITNNYVVDADYNGVNTSSILVNTGTTMSESIISNNIVLNSVGNGIHIGVNQNSSTISSNYVECVSGTSGRGYGIRLTGDTNNIVIIGNNLRDCNVGISNELSGTPYLNQIGNKFITNVDDMTGNEVSLIDNQLRVSGRTDFLNGTNVFGEAGTTTGTIRLDSSSGSMPSLTITGYEDGVAKITTSSSANRNLILNNTATTGNMSLVLADGSLIMFSPDGTEYTCGVANGGAFSCS